jgi:hypothetical protein
MTRLILTAALFASLACAGGPAEPGPAAPPVPTGSATPVAAAPVAAAPAPVPMPPDVTRMRLAGQDKGMGPYVRGDYLVALDYRDIGMGTYGFLYEREGSVWIVEQDKVVGGPFADPGPEIAKVVELWTAGEKARHQAVMNGIAAMPHGCLDGCVFDSYRAGVYQGRVVRY